MLHDCREGRPWEKYNKISSRGFREEGFYKGFSTFGPAEKTFSGRYYEKDFSGEKILLNDGDGPSKKGSSLKLA